MCRHIHSVSHTYASARDMLQIFQRGDLSTSAALIRQMKMIDAADANSQAYQQVGKQVFQYMFVLNLQWRWSMQQCTMGRSSRPRLFGLIVIVHLRKGKNELQKP